MTDSYRKVLNKETIWEPEPEELIYGATISTDVAKHAKEYNLEFRLCMCLRDFVTNPVRSSSMSLSFMTCIFEIVCKNMLNYERINPLFFILADLFPPCNVVCLHKKITDLKHFVEAIKNNLDSCNMKLQMFNRRRAVYE